MNEETKIARSKLHEALETVQQSSARHAIEIERTVSETGILLEALLPKWEALVANSLPERDAAALARAALHLLARYELLVAIAESKAGPLPDVPRSPLRWRDFWSDLTS
jgi:hypothetical protein